MTRCTASVYYLSAILAETAHLSCREWYVPRKFTRYQHQYEDHDATRAVESHNNNVRQKWRKWLAKLQSKAENLVINSQNVVPRIIQQKHEWRLVLCLRQHAQTIMLDSQGQSFPFPKRRKRAIISYCGSRGRQGRSRQRKITRPVSSLYTRLRLAMMVRVRWPWPVPCLSYWSQTAEKEQIDKNRETAAEGERMRKRKKLYPYTRNQTHHKYKDQQEPKCTIASSVANAESVERTLDVVCADAGTNAQTTCDISSNNGS